MAGAGSRSHEPPPDVGTILAAYARATLAADVRTLDESGTLTGEGLSGEFHTWRAGDDERDDERLGPRAETSLRLGERRYLRSSSGNVRELTGFMRRRALTADFIDSGAFLAAPERSRFVGYGDLAGTRAWRLEVRADGGEPETVWIDTSSGLPLRFEYLDGDGPTTLDLSDWREVAGRRFPFRTVESDGERAFDVVQQTTSLTVDGPIAADVFAPLRNRTLVADGVQTLPLEERYAHVACRVAIGGHSYLFLIDTGAQSVLLDSRVVKAAGLTEAGALEVRGAVRAGGLHVVTVPRLEIGSAHLDDLVVSSLDLEGTLGSGSRLDGILGYPFFASSLVELDFAHHRMRFGPPGSFEPRGTRVALDVDRGLAEAVLRIDGTVEAPFIVDTGNSGDLLLYRPFVKAHTGLVPGGDATVASYGIGGATMAYRTTLDEIVLGDIPLYHRATDVVLAEKGAFADRIDAGNVGLGTLRNFVVTFDMANRALYVRRGDAFDDGRFRTVTTGS